MSYNFNLEPYEAELLLNALQRQTNSLINKIQQQYIENQQMENHEITINKEEEDAAEGN